MSSQDVVDYVRQKIASDVDLKSICEQVEISLVKAELYSVVHFFKCGYKFINKHQFSQQMSHAYVFF